MSQLLNVTKDYRGTAGDVGESPAGQTIFIGAGSTDVKEVGSGDVF